MKKILDKKYIILLSLTVLAIVLDLVLSLARAYEELFLTILFAGILSSAFSLLSFFMKKVWLNFIALIFGIALVVLLIIFPSYFCFGGLIIYPISLCLTIIFMIVKS